LTPERWAQIEELFHRAVESDPQRRAAVLDEACGNDSDLREQVEALLSSDHSARSKMQAAVRSEFESVAFSLTGTTVSHYRILGGLGGGGMGLVYRAEDIKLGRRVAIKFLPEESAKDPDALQRFEREARSASALEHPNICPIYEFGEHESQPFLVMQLLEGQTLRELIASAEPGKPPCSIHKLIDIAIQISDGLNAAHRQGIIHRDIKPANIFVTAPGEVKILDFGLAKLAYADAETLQAEQATSRLPADLFLSRTGITMGTAAYMSPEQIRGEKLDPRTDLFSFGLVLYEMATGKRALKGETGPELQQAVLHQVPTPPRVLNAALPAKLEKIIERAVEKDRQARYQSASEIRADLQKLKREMDAHHLRWWAMGVGVALVAVSSIWFARHQQQSSLPFPELKLHQLTANSPENNVLGGMISPNGGYLAYSDLRGLHIKVLETGETRTIPRPKELGLSFEWKCAAWSPDSKRFLANSVPGGKNPREIADDDVTIWLVSLESGIPQKFRKRAFAWSFSPDGSLIAFGTKNGTHGLREIWVMDANGEHARKLFDSGNEDTINTASWSADGERLVYARDAGAEISLFSRDLKGGPPILLERPAEIGDKWIDYGTTLPDGRTIFSVTEKGGIGTSTCNFWALKNDLRTGKVIEKPRQLTHWAGFCMDPTSVTADGKKLVYTQMAGHPTIYVADLQARETRIANERHLTLSESMDVAADWTPDSQSLIFFSNRSGQSGIYKQRLDGDTPESLVARQEDLYVCCVTPDGHWFIYLTSSRTGQPQGATGELMRIPVAGGTSQELFSTRNLQWFGCARTPSNLCALAERSEDRKEVIVTSFDPERGRGREVARIVLDPNVNDWSMALSPDGKRLAVIRRSGAPLQILSSKGRVLQEIKIPEWSNSGPIAWSTNGTAVFVPVLDPEGAKLLNVSLRGDVHTLRVNRGGNYTAGVPSPDGRHLAIESTADNRNIWMMENF
jgi:serine/threonine protein kinase/Tol biopolymer transport system component